MLNNLGFSSIMNSRDYHAFIILEDSTLSQYYELISAETFGSHPWDY